MLIEMLMHLLVVDTERIALMSFCFTVASSNGFLLAELDGRADKELLFFILGGVTEVTGSVVGSAAFVRSRWRRYIRQPLMTARTAI